METITFSSILNCRFNLTFNLLLLTILSWIVIKKNLLHYLENIDLVHISNLLLLILLYSMKVSKRRCKASSLPSSYTGISSKLQTKSTVSSRVQEVVGIIMSDPGSSWLNFCKVIFHPSWLILIILSYL